MLGESINCFCDTHFTTYQRFVADQSAISPFLGGGIHQLFGGNQKDQNQTPPTVPHLDLRMSCTYQAFCVTETYGVALVSRIDKIVGLFCKRAL